MRDVLEYRKEQRKRGEVRGEEGRGEEAMYTPTNSNCIGALYEYLYVYIHEIHQCDVCHSECFLSEDYGYWALTE